MNQKLELSKLVDVIHHTALNVCCLILVNDIIHPTPFTLLTLTL